MVQINLNPQASFLRRWIGHFAAALSTIFLFTSIILANSIQMLSLLVWPFSRKLFRKINSTCAGIWWGIVVFFQEKIYGIRPIFTGDDPPAEENVFVIANHQAMTDILVLFGLAIRKRRLGNLKFFVKDILKFVPGMGWGMLFLDCLFLKRNWESDQQRITQTFGKFEREDIPLWLVSFVEGTRITPGKLEKSQKYAIEKGLPVLQNVLVPRTKGFAAVVKNLRGHLDAVYDVTITYPSGIPRLWQVVQGFVSEFHLHVTRYPIETLPFEDKALSDWLIARYVEKDRFLEKHL